MKKYNLKKGNILISLVFVTFIAFVGLSLLTFTIMHNRIVRARTIKLTETDRIYQDLIYYLHHFREKVFNVKIGDFAQPEQEYFNSSNFPDTTTGSNNQITPSFEYFEIPGEGYKKTRVIAAVTASSPTNDYCWDSEIFIDILSGEIPLTIFPFFMNIGSENPAPDDIETFLREKNIVNKSQKKVVVDNIEVEMNSHEFLMHALKVTGTSMTWREIREKFELPPSDEPIPAGIYFLVADDVLESIFVQGDIERMIFSVEDEIQKIRIIKSAVSYELFYNPGENYFDCWDYSVAGDILFKEKIIVNGSAWSIEQEGNGAFVQDSNITLLVTGKAVIRTDLETAESNFNLQQTRVSNLKLACSKKHLEHLVDQDSPGPEVVVSKTNNTEETKLQMSVMVDGKFTNDNSGLRLSGSLYCKNLENNGTIEIDHMKAGISEENYFKTVDFKYIDGFIISFIDCR